MLLLYVSWFWITWAVHKVIICLFCLSSIYHSSQNTWSLHPFDFISGWWSLIFTFKFIFFCVRRLWSILIRKKYKFLESKKKNISNYEQAQPIDPDLTAKLLGRGVAVSPIVTVEPRRRKFHKAITLSIPAPKAHSQGMINQYSGNAPTLRLLCSITGKKNCFYFS